MSPTAVATPDREAEKQRRKALEPSLRELRSLLERESGTDGSSSVKGDGNEIELDRWERVQLGLYFENTEADDPTPRLVANALAIVLKCAGESRTLLSTPDTGRSLYAQQAELMVSIHMGSTLAQEIEARTGELILAGENQRARELTRCKHRLTRSMAEGRKSIASSDRAADAEEVPDAAAAPRDLDRLFLEDQNTATWIRRRRRERRKRAGKTESRESLFGASGFLGVALLFTATAWFTLVFTPARSTERARLVTIDDFPSAGLMTSVDARPPSVYIRVETLAWNGLTEIEQRGLIGEISRIIEPAGYNGALLVNGEGIPLGQWLKLRGMSLLDSEAESQVSSSQAHAR